MEIGHLGFLQIQMETSADIAGILPCQGFARKHQLRFHRTASIFVLQQFEGGLIERDGASFAIFRFEHGHGSPKQVYPGLRQVEDLSHPHAGMDGKQHEFP